MRYDNRKLSHWRKKQTRLVNAVLKWKCQVLLKISQHINTYLCLQNLNLFTQPNYQLSFCLWSYDKAVSVGRYDVTFDILFMALVIWTLRWAGGNGGFWGAGEDVGEVFDRRGREVELSLKEWEWRWGGEAGWRWISKARQDTLRRSRNRSRRSLSRRKRI